MGQDVIIGRGNQGGIGQVDRFHLFAPGSFTDEFDIAAVSEIGDITGGPQGFKNGELVFDHGVLARGAHFSQYRDGAVDQLHED